MAAIPNDPEVQAELAWDSGNCQVWASVFFKSKAEMDAFTSESEENKQEFKRQNVIYELVNAERTFVKNLLILKHVYQEPLLQIISKDVCDRIFPNLQELIELSRTFKNDMLALLDPETKKYPDVAETIAKFVNQPALNSEFSKFCANGNGPFLKEQMKNEKFAEMVQACEKDSSKNYKQRSDLKSLLPCVFQKSTRVLMLIEPVLKYTAKGTAEYDLLTECIAKAKAFTKCINDAVGEESNSRVEKSARGWLITRRKSMSLKPGDCKMNYSATLALGDTNMNVNVLLYDQHIVLFPSDEAIMYNAEEAEPKSKGKSKKKSEVDVVSIGFENNVYVTKSEDPCKFFIISTDTAAQPEPKVYTIVFVPVADKDPEKKAKNIDEAKEKCEKIYRELNQTCRAHTIAKMEESARQEASSRDIAELDAEILSLLSTRMEITEGQDFTSFESVLTNLSGVTSGYESDLPQKKNGFFKKIRQSISANPKREKPKLEIGRPELQHTSSNQVEGARELTNVEENGLCGEEN